MVHTSQLVSFRCYIGKQSLKDTFYYPDLGHNAVQYKILDRIVMAGDGEGAKLRMHWSLIAATESGASGLAERVSMMPFGSFIFIATFLA